MKSGFSPKNASLRKPGLSPKNASFKKSGLSPKNATFMKSGLSPKNYSPKNNLAAFESPKYKKLDFIFAKRSI